MYNGDIYSIIIEESRHIQDAIHQGGGGGGSHDYSSILSQIASDVDSTNTVEKSSWFNRCAVIVVDTNTFQSATDTSITSIFNLPADGTIEERFFSFSLYAYSSKQSTTVQNTGCKVYVKDSQNNKFYISEHGTFSTDRPLSRNALSNFYLDDPTTSLMSQDAVIVGIFHYSSYVQ